MKHYIDKDGIVRWESNNRVPFNDKLEEFGYSDYTISKCAKVRKAEAILVIKSYVDNYTGPSDEELFDIQAAFGPGATLVNVFTNAKIIT